MVQDLINYVEGKLMIENRTKSKIYLSNGKVYNDRLFHQQAAVVREMLVYLANLNDPTDAESVLLEQAIEIRRKAIKNAKERILAKLKATTKSQIIVGLDWKFPFGAHVGKTISEVVQSNPKYVEWFINNAIKLDNIFALYQHESYAAFLKEKEASNLKSKTNDTSTK